MAKKKSQGQKLLDAFDRKAQAHGWEADQGSERAAEQAKREYEKAYSKLLAYVHELESRVNGPGI